jgi:Mlc titration factor MtfA (ptsG expression regulator)
MDGIMEAWFWLILAALAIAAPMVYARWSLRRALSRALAPDEHAVLERAVPFLHQLAPELQRQLLRMVAQFLHQKKFVGCAGLEVSDEMRLTIAAQACLLLLNKPSKVYRSLHTVLLYPGAFIAGRDEVGPGGVVTAARQHMLGESWSDGRIVLSWDDVQRGTLDWQGGNNVVLHEFAHQLDSESGHTNGAPYLGSPDSYRSWSEVLSRDYANLRHEAWLGRQDSVLDHYGATSPAEFFAVATETFFTRPWQLAERHAALYGELQQYFRVDPRDWLPAPPPPVPAPTVLSMPMPARSYAWADW